MIASSKRNKVSVRFANQKYSIPTNITSVAIFYAGIQCIEVVMFSNPMIFISHMKDIDARVAVC